MKRILLHPFTWVSSIGIFFIVFFYITLQKKSLCCEDSTLQNTTTTSNHSKIQKPVIEQTHFYERNSRKNDLSTQHNTFLESHSKSKNHSSRKNRKNSKEYRQEAYQDFLSLENIVQTFLKEYPGSETFALKSVSYPQFKSAHCEQDLPQDSRKSFLVQMKDRLELGYDTVIVYVDSVVSNDDMLHFLNQNPQIALAEADVLCSLFTDVTRVSEEPFFDYQWSRSYVHNSISGSMDSVTNDSTYTFPCSGGITQDVTIPADHVVKVAVIDSGCQIVETEINGANDTVVGAYVNPSEKGINHIDDDHNGYVDDYAGWSFATSSRNVGDRIGHGTGVSMLILANDYNQFGIAGLAPITSVQVLPIQVTRNSLKSVLLSNIILAISYAVMRDVDIINMSLGTEVNINQVRTFQNACDDAYDAGIILVAAAGNTGRSTPVYPAGFDNVIGVGAVDSLTGDRLSLSSYGSWVTISAPGSAILTRKMNLVAPESQAFDRGVPFGRYSGTSVACPFATALLSFLLLKDPDLTPSEARSILVNGAKEIPNSELAPILDFSNSLNILCEWNHTPYTWEAPPEIPSLEDFVSPSNS